MKYTHRFLSGLIFSAAILLPSALRSADDPLPLLRIADRYFERQNYPASITEYWRFIYFSDAHPYLFYAYYKAGVAEARQNHQREAGSLLRRALQLAPGADFRLRIRYQLILTLLSQQAYDMAKIELFKMANNQESPFFRRAARLYMGSLYLSEGSFEKARREFKQLKENEITDPEFQKRVDEIDRLLTQLSATSHQKSPRLAKWLSTFVPGAGQLYAGQLLNGLDALALNMATSYFLYRTVERKNYRDAALVFSFLWWRYYNGNRLRAEEAAIRSNRIKREKISAQIYQLLEELSSRLPEEKVVIEWSDLPPLTE